MQDQLLCSSENSGRHFCSE